MNPKLGLIRNLFGLFSDRGAFSMLLIGFSLRPRSIFEAFCGFCLVAALFLSG
jgi:hypothetical protein